MREIENCPRERPFWCSHPHCLFCNWDDNRRQAASALAAYVVAQPGFGRRRSQPLPLAFLRESRSYIAWLCAECARTPGTVRWFVEMVRCSYPGAVVVARPGTAEEGPLAAGMR